jgi:hypothetical protein
MTMMMAEEGEEAVEGKPTASEGQKAEKMPTKG